jgi:hypothetical protein
MRHPRAGARLGHIGHDVGTPAPIVSLTPEQQQTASQTPWYRQWLLDNGSTEHDLIPFDM